MLLRRWTLKACKNPKEEENIQYLQIVARKHNWKLTEIIQIGIIWLFKTLINILNILNVPKFVFICNDTYICLFTWTHNWKLTEIIQIGIIWLFKTLINILNILNVPKFVFICNDTYMCLFLFRKLKSFYEVIQPIILIYVGLSSSVIITITYAFLKVIL